MRFLSACLLALTLTSCSLTDEFSPNTVNGVPNVSVTESKNARQYLASATRLFTVVRELPSLDCCDELPVLFTLSSDDVILELSSGRSFVKLIKLTPQLRRQDLTLTSLVSQTVFAPQVQFYTEDFLLIDSLTAYRYRPFSYQEPDRLEITLPLSQYKTPVHYVLVYTSQSEMDTYTPLLDIESKYDRNLGLDIMPRPWFIAPHAPTGTLILNRAK